MGAAVLQEWLEEGWRIPRRALNLARWRKGELEPAVAQTPSVEIARWGRVRLLRYGIAEPAHACPVLMVPSIINRYYVLDLRPGCSLVEFLINEGIPVYMLDWGTPGPQDRFATMEDHVLRWLGAAVRTACKDAGVSAVHLFGYCVGGTFAAAYAAIKPRRVAGLVALAAPVGFRDDGTLSHWAGVGNLPVERLEKEWGLIPGAFLQGAFSLLKPLSFPLKMRTLGQQFWNDRFLERFMALEAWLNDNVDLPGPTYRALVRDLYEGDLLRQGELHIGRRRVELSNVHCPVLTAISETDHIVPEKSAALLNDLVSSRDRTLLRFKGGHIGITVGRAARNEFWPALRDWLVARPCLPRYH